MQCYLKFFCNLVLITLLGTACEKEALITLDQSVSAASISSKSGGSFRSSSQRRGSTSSESSISSESSTASSGGGKINIQQSSSSRFQMKRSSFKQVDKSDFFIEHEGNVNGYTTTGVSRADEHGTFKSYTTTRVEITSKPGGDIPSKPQHFRGAAANKSQYSGKAATGDTQHPH